MSRFTNNGSGLDAPEGFSVHEGSGYVIRRSRYGCQTVWPGYFSDKFNRSTSNLGPMWSDFWGGAGGLYADGGFLKNRDTQDLEYVICSSMPVNMPHQSAQAVWRTGTYTVGVDGAGPAVYCARDGFGLGYCYALRIKNIDGDVTSSGRVSLIRVSANVTTNIASASLTDNPPFGPLNQHTWTIEANLENSTHANDVRLKV